MNSSGKKGVLFMLDRVHTIKKTVIFDKITVLYL